jgi:hypothetical protein
VSDPKLTVEEVQALPKQARRWMRSRICGWCEISLMSRRCGGYSGEHTLPVIEGVRDEEEVVDLGPACNMDERRGLALKHYKPRKHPLTQTPSSVLSGEDE